MIKKIFLAFGLLVALGASAAVAWIGPRNLVGMWRYDQRREGNYKVGDAAPDVELLDLDGTTHVHLRDRFGSKPLVLVFGSFT